MKDDMDIDLYHISVLDILFILLVLLSHLLVLLNVNYFYINCFTLLLLCVCFPGNQKKIQRMLCEVNAQLKIVIR